MSTVLKSDSVLYKKEREKKQRQKSVAIFKQRNYGRNPITITKKQKKKHSKNR